MVRLWVVSPRASVPPRYHIRHQLLQCIVTGGSAVSAVSCCDVSHSRSVRDPHGRARATGAVEGEGQSAVGRCFGLVVAHTRRLIHHKSFFGDFCANDRSDIYLEFLPRPL